MRKGRWRIVGDHAQGTERVDVAERRNTVGHLDERDAQRPHIGLLRESII